MIVSFFVLFWVENCGPGGPKPSLKARASHLLRGLKLWVSC